MCLGVVSVLEIHYIAKPNVCGHLINIIIPICAC